MVYEVVKIVVCFISTIQNKKIKNDEIVSKVVSLIEEKEAEILNKK